MLVLRPVLGFWVFDRLRFALRHLALRRVCAIARSVISGWRSFFPSVSVELLWCRCGVQGRGVSV
jgi:hypothetical protein